MWNLVKIPVEPLVPETFAPFGHVIRTFEERKPDKVKGDYATNAYPVLATPGPEPKDGPGWYALHPQRVPISEGLERAHFAFHTDAGQSFYPSLHSPSVFLVGAIQDDIQAEDLRAFYSAGDVRPRAATKITKPTPWKSTSTWSAGSPSCRTWIISKRFEQMRRGH